MKIFWLTNIPLPAAAHHSNANIRGSGHWMTALLEELKQSGNAVAVATVYPGVEDSRFTADGVDYFLLRQSPRSNIFDPNQKTLAKIYQIIVEWQPDVIHIHGTERFYGLLAFDLRITAPIVVSIQGLLGPYLKHYFGSLTLRQLVRAHKLLEFLTMRGPIWHYLQYRRASNQERRILRSGVTFLGRTDWDRAQLLMANPKARYRKVDELLRKEFRSVSWDPLNVEPDTIVVTSSGEPRRGLETILEAISSLLRIRPGLRLKIIGNVSLNTGYGRHLQREINRLKLSQAITFLGYLDGTELVGELVKCSIYVCGSFIENSPNALCEAMILGLPCVATYTGGIPTLMIHDVDGLLYPPGDSALLACHIESLLSNPNNAKRLSKSARARALVRHSPSNVMTQLLNAYDELIQQKVPATR